MTATTLTFDAMGNPAGQGSKRIVPSGKPGGRLHVIETNHGKKADWRATLVHAAYRAHNLDRLDTNGNLVGPPTPPMVGPLHCAITFRFPLPMSRPKAQRRQGTIPKQTAPDLDKLIRNVLDALTQAAVIIDDRYISDLTAAKVETVEWTGATITLRPRPATEGMFL